LKNCQAIQQETDGIDSTVLGAYYEDVILREARKNHPKRRWRNPTKGELNEFHHTVAGIVSWCIMGNRTDAQKDQIIEEIAVSRFSSEPETSKA